MSVRDYDHLRKEVILLGETLRICKEPKVKYKGSNIRILNFNNRIISLELNTKGKISFKKIPLNDDEYKYLTECAIHLKELF